MWLTRSPISWTCAFDGLRPLREVAAGDRAEPLTQRGGVVLAQRAQTVADLAHDAVDLRRDQQGDAEAEDGGEAEGDEDQVAAGAVRGGDLGRRALGVGVALVRERVGGLLEVGDGLLEPRAQRRRLAGAGRQLEQRAQRLRVRLARGGDALGQRLEILGRLLEGGTDRLELLLVLCDRGQDALAARVLLRGHGVTAVLGEDYVVVRALQRQTLGRVCT
jgi:hypothetical protein